MNIYHGQFDDICGCALHRCVDGGTEHEVKWYGKDISSVKLEYSLNNGLNWTTVESNLTNTGVYLWSPIPTVPSELAKFRITDVDNSDNVDESDTTFSILPESNISITSPSVLEL